MQQCCCTWERKYCLTRTESFFSLFNQFSTQKSHQQSSQVKTVQKKAIRYLCSHFTLPAEPIFCKTKNPLTEILVQGFHFTFSSLKKLVTTHGRLTAAAQLLQRHSSFLTLYVSRHNCTASFADWNYQFSYSVTCLEQMRCTYCLDRMGEHE